MRRSIIIVDDFHDNPQEVRDYAISATYSRDPENTYSGRNSKEFYYNDTIHKKFELLSGHKLKPSNPCGYFRYSHQNSNEETGDTLQMYHVDNGWDFGAVIYLGTEEQLKANPKSGTIFGRHNNLKFDATPRTREEAEIFGYTHYDELRQSIIYGDGLDLDKWTTYASVPPKFNRLVLFRAWMFHSHHINYGIDDPAQSRLVQLFFFNIDKK